MVGQVNVFFGKCAELILAGSVLICVTVDNWDTGWVYPHSTTCRQVGQERAHLIVSTSV